MDSERLKLVIDLHDLLDSLGTDRPPIGWFLKELGIEPKVMSDAVSQAAFGIHATQPEYAIALANYLFKFGVTVGYKAAIKKQMEKEFGMTEQSDEIEEN